MKKVLMQFFIFSASLFGNDVGQQAMSDESWEKIHRANDFIDFLGDYGFYILVVIVIFFFIKVAVKKYKHAKDGH